ncbi:MAG TPA: PAS domain S-box protein [Gemmatimonadales bacterium]|nr:PAS domain S-box protein [Gemmatimonadales bacterium]
MTVAPAPRPPAPPEALPEMLPEALRLVLGVLPHSLVVLDETGTIVAVNARWREHAARARLIGGAGTVGDNYLGLTTDDRSGHREAGEAAAAGVREVILGWQEEYRLEYEGGEPGRLEWFLLRATRVATAGRAYVLVAHEDIGDRKRVELQLRARTQYQGLISRLGGLALAGLPLDRLFEEAVTVAALGLGVEKSAILELRPGEDAPDGRALVCCAQIGWAGLPVGLSIPAGSGAHAEYALTTGEPVVMEDVALERRFVPCPILRAARVVSGIAVIIQPGGTAFGALTVHATKARRFAAEDVAFVQAVANTLAAAVLQARAIGELRRSRQEFAAVVENSPDLIARFDRAGRHLYVNPAVAAVTGRPVTDFFGRTHEELELPAELCAASRRGLAEVFRRGEPGELEFELAGPNGTRWFHSKIVPERDANGEVATVLSIARDMTEQRWAEAALREREEHFRSLIEDGSDIILELALDGRLCYASPSAARATGYPAHSLLGRSILAIVHPEDQVVVRHGLATCVAAADPVAADPVAAEVPPAPVELRVRHADDSWHVYEANCRPRPQAAGEPTLIVNLHDLTELRRAEGQRRETALRLEATLESMGDAFYMVDRGFRVLYLNRQTEVLLGRSRTELLGRCIWELYDGLRESVFGCAFERVMATGQREEVSGYLPALERWFEARVHPSEGGLSVYFSDVTARVQAERALHEREAQLRQVQKMEAVGQLAGGIAHDFNNLLTAITTTAEMTLAELGADPATRGAMGEILGSSRRAAALTRQLLAFSRRQELQPQVLDLAQVIAEAEKMLRRLIGENIALEASYAEGSGLVKADPGQLEQVLVNLVVNARDAMSGGGRLTIATANVEVDAEEAAGRQAMQPGAYVRLTVTDTGCGMDAETQARIFEPFFTTKEVGYGTGLGLATVYGIVKQSEGYIYVESAPGAGTTFTILLPRASGTAAAYRTAARLDPAALPRGTETVLLVEDEDVVRNSVRRILTRHGYKVVEAVSGVDALRLCEARTEPIDLVITDVVMPEMGGVELYRELAARHAGLKVLFLSGYTADGIAAQLGPATPISFVEKPFEMPVLLQRVRELLAPTPTGAAA